MIRASIALLGGAYALQLSSFLAAFGFIFVASAILTLARRRWELGWLLLGAVLFAATAWKVISDRLVPDYEGDSMLTVVRVVDFPSYANSTARMLVAPVDDARLPPLSRVSWYEPHVLPRLGDVWQFELRLRRPRGSRNPGVFDYEAWLFRQRAGATGYVVAGERNRLLAADSTGLRDGIRLRLAERIERVVDDDASAALLIAIVTGARHLITRDQWQRFAKTGTSHLMAISGLHVGLAGLAAYVVAGVALAAAGVFRSNHEIALIVGFVAASAYVVASGFAVPAQRALLMLALGTATALRRRQLRPLSIVSATCIAVVLVDPLATMQPGFKLSFAAVLVLFWLAARLPAGSTLTRNVSAQLMLTTGLAALTAMMFQRIAPYAVPINLIAVPIFTFATIPAALIGAIVGVDLGLVLAAHTLTWIEWLITRTAELPGSDLRVPAVTGKAFLFVALPFAWALFPSGWPGRHAAWVGLLALALWRPAAPAFGCVQTTVLDVGQGLAVVLRTNRHAAVYDTGPSFRGGGSAAEYVVRPHLDSVGITRLDKLLVSHADLDHAGGLEDLLRGVAVDEVLFGEPPFEPDTFFRQCQRGVRWRWDGIDFRVLHPAGDDKFAGNDASCVLLVEAGRHRVLLAGDIEAAAEQQLVRDDVLPRVDVVTVPHHGSGTSSSAVFVDRLAPQLAIVSAAHNNRWGFPRPAVEARWKRQGAILLETAKSGAVSFVVCQRSGVGAVRQERKHGRRVWHEL